MDIRNIVKILAIAAVLFLVYKLWSNKSGGLSIPKPYENFMNKVEGDEYDMEDEIAYPETDDEDDVVESDEEEEYEEEQDDEEAYDDTSDNETSVPKVMQPMMPLLTPSSQLLPKPTPESQDFAQFAPKNLEAQNFLTASQWIGVNTQGSSLKNANYDLRADPVIPKADIGPWMNSSIDPNIYAKPLFG